MDDDFNRFFSFKEDLVKTVIATGSNLTYSIPVEREDSPEPIETGLDYAAAAQAEEQNAIMASYHKITDVAGPSLNDMELASTVGTVSAREKMMDGLTDVYSKYNFDYKSTKELPIHSMKDKILNTIMSHQVTIIQGSTGCGKTTQVPQFILDSSKERDVPCNIVVTQPRKIAAISIANRVCRERGWQIGDLVGYKVGLDGKVGNDTRLQYVTTGVLLQLIINAQNMTQYTHVILDEVHERDQEMDFTLLVVRKLLCTNSPFVKIILMSATFNTERFSNYFSLPSGVGSCLQPAVILTLQKQREFAIKEFYLDHIKMFVEDARIDYHDPSIKHEFYVLAYKLLKLFNKYDEKHAVPDNKGDSSKDVIQYGSVLIFLPGLYEIETLYNILTEKMVYEGYKWHLVPLHSSITSEEQQNVFRAAPRGYRKIILSTNIAESSITVPDVTYVIDYCLTKLLMTKNESTFSTLVTSWASKSNCVQRAGRVGRVAAGRVYKMVDESFYQSYLKEDCDPEMTRAPLARLILLAKQLQMGPPKFILGLAMDPPDLSNIGKTVLLLKETGGLLRTLHKQESLYDGDLTFLGIIMSSLPVDIHVTKLIMLGYIFDCLDECIIMGAAMTQKSIFSAPFNERVEAYTAKLTWADGSMSDPIAFLNAYQVWIYSIQQNHFRKGSEGEKSWAKRYFIQIKAMKEVAALVEEIRQRLAFHKIKANVGVARGQHCTETDKLILLKTLIAGAFYPNYFVRSNTANELEAVKCLGGRSPYNTVYFTNMDGQQPGELYAKSIKKAMKHCDSVRSIKVEFDSSSKVYVTFSNNASEADGDTGLNLNCALPGRIPISVYQAVKMRKLGMNVIVKVLHSSQSQEAFSNRVESTPEATLRKLYDLKNVLPKLDVKYISFKISHFCDAGNFFVTELAYLQTVQSIKDLLNNAKDKLIPMSENKLPQLGQICAAPYEDFLYRVRVDDIISSKKGGKTTYVKVFFVDYGNSMHMYSTDLYDLGSLTNIVCSYPKLAFEVVLSNVRPSQIKNAGVVWSSEINEKVHDILDGQILSGVVYSVVQGVCYMSVQKDHLNIREWLILHKYGQHCEESYLSKANHDLRINFNQLSQTMVHYHNKQQENMYTPGKDIEPPPLIDCKFQMRLNGPFSPLETSAYAYLNTATTKLIAIDPNSCNSVLLDTNPQDSDEPLIVASELSQNQGTDRVTLRNTTVMPSIDGFGALMAMLFCSTLKLVTNDEGTRYVAALCGLGANERGHSLFPEHDLTMPFKVEISNEDIQAMNRLRCYMESFLHVTLHDGTVLEASQLKKSGPKLKELLMRTLMTERRLQDANYSLQSLRWDTPGKLEVMAPHYNVFADPKVCVFPVHHALKLNEENVADKMELLVHHAELVEICETDTTFETINCRLCDLKISSKMELRLHMLSRVHRDRYSTLPKVV